MRNKGRNLTIVRRSFLRKGLAMSALVTGSWSFGRRVLADGPLDGREAPSLPEREVAVSQYWTAGDIYDELEVPGYPKSGELCTVPGVAKREAGFYERSSLGFSAADVLDMFNQKAHATATWADGRRAQISLHASSSATKVSYDDWPKYQANCKPNMDVPLDEVTMRSSDGRLDAKLNQRNERSPELIAVTDGSSGISMIFGHSFVFDPGAGRFPLLDEAASVHPEHTVRRIQVSFTLSPELHHKATCIVGSELSADPLVGCNIYDGVLTYISWPSERFDNRQAPFRQSLGVWSWRD